jgi:hypothetical protein
MTHWGALMQPDVEDQAWQGTHAQTVKAAPFFVGRFCFMRF